MMLPIEGCGLNRDRRRFGRQPVSEPSTGSVGGSRMTIRNPIEWSGAQLVQAAHALKSAGDSLHHIQDTIHSPAPAVRRIRIDDIRDALWEGFGDFKAYRSDVLFLGVIYAVA